MAKYLGIVAFACLCFWVAFILFASKPIERVNRICMPVGWSINTLSAAGALASPRAETLGRAFGTDLYQSCRFFTFRVFYADLYRELQARERARQEESQQQAVEQPNEEGAPAE